MFTKDNIFGKICLKALRDTFLQYVICSQGRGGVRHEEKEEDSLGMSESSILILHKNILRSVLGLNTVIILKRVRDSIFSFKATNLRSCKIFDGFPSTQDYPSI